jgi:hypothetical protein
MFLFMQVFNPPIFPKPDPPKWHDGPKLWGGITIFVSAFLGALGFAVTENIRLAHVCFAAAWLSGSFSLWFFCKGVFPARNKLAWVITSLLLGIILAACDLYAIYAYRAMITP